VKDSTKTNFDHGGNVFAVARSLGVSPEEVLDFSASINPLVPDDYKAEGVIAAFRAFDVKGKRFLFPRGDKARDVIPSGLADLGGEVLAPRR
jgi:hypothetical protein